MKHLTTLALGLLALSACSTKKMEHDKTAAVESRRMETVTDYTYNWPHYSMRAATEMINKYGRPGSASSDALTWSHISPFKRIIVHRTGMLHKFPFPHYDVVEHVVDYRVPANKIDELSAFNGSIQVDRTMGELSSRCDREDLNVLVLNFAHDILNKGKSVGAAREEFGQSTERMLKGESGAEVALLFEGQSDSGDPDISLKGLDVLRQAEEASSEDEALMKAEREELAE